MLEFRRLLQQEIKQDSEALDLCEACWYPSEIGTNNMEVVKLILACHINCLRCLTEYENGLGITVSDGIIALKRRFGRIFVWKQDKCIYNGFL